MIEMLFKDKIYRFEKQIPVLSFRRSLTSNEVRGLATEKSASTEKRFLPCGHNVLAMLVEMTTNPTTEVIMNNKCINWIIVTLKESAWAPLSVVIFYFIGLALHLFDMYPPLDIPTHFMGGVAITYFYRSIIRNSQRIVGDIPLSIQIVFAFTTTGTTTILWEFYENIMDRFFGFHMVRGLEDTLVDLILGLSGALVLSLLYRNR
jgi:hypothetical protein